jgi:hypothetical protein
MLDTLTWTPLETPTQAVADWLSSARDARSRTRVDAATLPFYQGVRLLRAREEEAGTACRFALETRRDVVHLDGTSPPIHAVNAIHPPVVTVDTVLGYLQFFCFFVRGADGPFYVVTTANDPAIPESTRARETEINGVQVPVREVLAGPAVLGQDPAGRLLCAGLVSYGDALFAAHFAVAANGNTEMLDDDLLANDLEPAILPALA